MEARLHHTSLGDIRYWVTKSTPEKPWLVFLPGLSADHTLFQKQLTYFSDRFSCFVWDAPGHGESRPFTLRFSLDDLADYLHDILEAERITLPVLIGQSMGGYISQSYIVRYPKEVLGFVSIDSASISRKYYRNWELASLKHTKAMYMSIPWKLLLEWGIAGTSTTAYGRENMRKAWSVYGREEYCTLADHGFRIVAEAVESRAEYPISCPTLLLCGERDAAGFVKRYNRQWTRLDGHRLVWLKGAGHNANTDVPERVNSLIEEFVSGLL